MSNFDHEQMPAQLTRATELALALLAKAGVNETRKIRQLAAQLRDQRAFFIPTLACIAARDDARTAGVLMSLLLPACTVSVEKVAS